jgi:hypothetical protein
MPWVYPRPRTDASAAYVADLVEELLASGLVRDALVDAGQDSELAAG